MKKMKQLTILFLLAQTSFGAIHTVAASGGTLSTIAQVNAHAFVPGDSILFKRGEIWYEQLVVPSSGSSGSPIVFCAYGTGANPIFDGSNTRYGTFDDNGKNYIILDGIDQRNTGGIVSQTHGNIAIHGQHNIVRNLSTYNSVRHPLDLYTGAKYCLVENVTAYNSFSTTPVAIYGAYVGTVDQDTLRSCTFWNYPGGVGGDAAVINHGNTTNIVIENCDISGGNLANWGQVIIDEATVNNTILRYNKFHGKGGGSISIGPANAGPANCQIYHNIFLLDSLDNSALSSGIVINSSTGTRIYNNTFYGNNGQPAIRLSGSSTGTTIRNNIASATSSFTNIASAAQSGTTCDYNLVNGNWGMWGITSFTTLATWRSGTGQDAHSLSADPLFTNAGQRDFTLQSTSPAIDTGTNVSLTIDYAGNSIPYGSAHDIGAYEYIVGGSTPTLSSISPTSGTQGQTLNVIFTGSKFVSGVSSVNVGSGITVNSTTVNSSTQMSANLTISASATSGTRNFSVTNAGGGTSAAQTFTVGSAPSPDPTLTSIAPTSGNRLQTLNVVCTGSNFSSGVASVDFGSGITVNSTVVNSPTQLTTNITIAVTAATGPRNVSVSNSGAGTATLANAFTVNNPMPTLTTISPTSGVGGQTLNVVFTGSNFISGVSSVDVGSGITVNSATVNSSTQLTANLTISASATTVARSFLVTNAAPGGGTSSGQTFTIRIRHTLYLTKGGTGHGQVAISGGPTQSLPYSELIDVTGNTSVQLQAFPATGSTFLSWSGDLTGTNALTLVQLNADKNVTANFTLAPIQVTVGTNPSGRTFTVDGSSYSSPQTFSWSPGSGHSIATTSPQSGGTGTQYVFSSWSDGGAMSHSITTPNSNTSYTASFGTQYYLTMTAGSGGTVSPTSGWQNGGQSVQINASGISGYSFDTWAGSGAGSYTGTNNPATVTMGGPITETAAFRANPTGITVQTIPSGRSISVDGSSYTSPQTFQWTPGSTHTIGTTATQAGGTGIQYLFASWDDNGSMSHTITVPSGSAAYTASFTAQYYLTMNAGSEGTLSPSSGWHNSGQSVQISASANSGYTFAGWTGSGTGSYTGSANPATVTMNAPITETASFTLGPVQVTVGTSPTGRTFSVDGSSYSSPQTFSWTPVSSHSISTTATQSGGTGVQYVFSRWSDGGAMSHSITTPNSNNSYTASFGTQYYLTMNAGSGGTVSPTSGWQNGGASVEISATTNSDYEFHAWTGTGTGSYTGPNASATVTVNGPITETASFFVTTAVSDCVDLPRTFYLDHNYPNPFNPSTTIRYGLPHKSQVTLTVYNTLGQEVAQLVNGEVEAGYREVRFDCVGLASGVYFCRLQVGDYVATKTLLLLR